MMFLGNLVAETTGVATSLSNVVTSEMLQGVFNEILALLPVAIPVVVGFIGIRKGISFLIGILRSA